MRRTTILILALAVLLGACAAAESLSRGDRAVAPPPDDGRTTTTAPTPPPPPRGGGGLGAGAGTSLVGLQQFGACDSFLGWVRAAPADKVGPYGLDPGGPVLEVMATDGAGAAGTPVPAAADPAEFSTTNVQELGVDEPDIVKTDGSRLYVVSGGTLHLVDITDPAAPAVADRIRVLPDEASVAEILLGPDRVYAIATVWGPTEHPLESLLPDGWDLTSTVVVEIAVSGEGDLTESSRLAVDGTYVAARHIGDGIRLVVRHDMGRRLGFLHPSHHGNEQEALEHNRRVILESELEDWVASYRLTTPAGEESGLLTECGRMTAPREFSGASSLSVLTLDTTAPLDTGNAVTLLGAAETVYASPTALYAATYAFPPVMPAVDLGGRAGGDADPWPDFATRIHRFDITDPAGAAYTASGEVPGRLLSQWAMSEHDGYLRVAVTEGSPWWCCRRDSVSSVVVLAREGRRLVEVGSVGGLGVDEDIVGVRFHGDTGYVVTFRLTDPLYVLDLADPAAPRMAGELKITGYSAYLHPLGDGLLLGVGQEATPDGASVGTKVSLFDVSDPAHPEEVDRWVLEGSSSSVEWDHRAFLYWEQGRLALVPLDWAGDGTAAVAFHVGDGTLDEVGRLAPLTPTGGAERVARGVVVGDVLWTVGDESVQSHHLDGFDILGRVSL